jgi:PhnB protein
MVAKLPPGTPCVTPHLFYDDVGAAIDWVVEAFGFVVRVRMTDDDGVVVHGELEIDDGMVMFGLTAENAHWESPHTLDGRISQRLFIYVDDVDTHYERACRAGARAVYEPADQFYGDRVYECIDPEGHRWKFGQHLLDVDMATLKRPTE